MVKCGEVKSKAYWPVPGSESGCSQFQVGYTTPSSEDWHQGSGEMAYESPVVACMWDGLPRENRKMREATTNMMILCT